MPRKINIKRSVLAADEEYATRVRERMHKERTLMVNLIGSPGAGKTTLLEATLGEIPLKCAVIEGDVATSRDAERISKTGTPVVQINTQGGCHLEAHLLWKALDEINLSGLDILFVENVGNLVCPAEFDLGEDYKVAVCSVPEGADKPLKYPHLFHEAGAVVLTKVDLVPYIGFDSELFWSDVKKLNPLASCLEVESLNGKGIDAWSDVVERWLMEKRQ
jgi:hydrogenase nickel incorporation protein HypB